MKIIYTNKLSYPLVMTVTQPWYRWPMKIDGLPFLKMGGSFHGYVTNNQMVNKMVGGLEHVWIIFQSVGNFIIPTDSYFSEGQVNHQPE